MYPFYGELNKLKGYVSSTTPENAKCEIFKRGFHYAINDVEMYSNEGNFDKLESEM